MSKRQLYLIALLNAFFFVDLSGQELSIDDILLKVERYYRLNTPEKVYLHHPKDQYAKGEKLWFAAYLCDGLNNRPTQSSRILYAELIHQDTREIYRKKVRIAGGYGNGFFELSDTLRSGNYLLRGYTHYMRNFGEKYFFYDQVLITDNHNSKVVENTSEGPVSSVQFFPEGGRLVSGVANRIAFRGYNNRGKAVPFNGVLMDDKGNQVAVLESDENGLGTLFFNPQMQNYSVEISGKKFEFPQPESSGINLLTFMNASDQLVINVQPNRNYLRNSEGRKYLIIQSPDFNVLTVEPELKRRGFVASIPKSNLPQGLLNIALVNSAGELEAERLFFNSPQNIDIGITKTKSRFQRRDKVTLDLKAMNGAQPVQGTFSIAVADKRQMIFGDRKLSSYLTLFSEIDGFVEEPERYQNFDDPAVLKKLDELLLTRKWKKFDWKAVLNDDYPSQTFNNEKFLWLRGNVYQVNSEEPLVDKRVAVLLVENELMAEYGTDEYGDFYIPFPDFKGEDMAFLSFEGWDKDEMGFTLEQPYGVEEVRISQFPKSVLINEIQSPSLQSILTSFDFYKEDESETAEENLDDELDPYAHEDDQLIFLDDYVRLNSVPEILREIIPGVSLKNPNRNDVETRIYSSELGANFNGPPLFLVDEVPTYDTDLIFSLDPSTIESVGVIRSFDAIEKYGTIAQNGIIQINSRTGNFASNLSATVVKYQGFGYNGLFEAPDYSEGQRNSRIPDLRHVLYWNPAVTTDERGNATIEFFTADLITDYEIVVEGFGSEIGHGSLSTTINVVVVNN